MKLDLDRFERNLAKNERWVLKGGRGLTLECRRGSVWLTQDHDSRDIILQPGGSFTLDRDGPACITAFECSLLVAVASPERAYPAARSVGTWRARLNALIAPIPSRSATT